MRDHDTILYVMWLRHVDGTCMTTCQPGSGIYRWYHGWREGGLGVAYRPLSRRRLGPIPPHRCQPTSSYRLPLSHCSTRTLKPTSLASHYYCTVYTSYNMSFKHGLDQKLDGLLTPHVMFCSLFHVEICQSPFVTHRNNTEHVVSYTRAMSPLHLTL